MGNLHSSDSSGESESTDRISEQQQQGADTAELREVAVDSQQKATELYKDDLEYQRKFQPATALSVAYRANRDGENVTGFEIVFDKSNQTTASEKLLAQTSNSHDVASATTRQTDENLEKNASSPGTMLEHESMSVLQAADRADLVTEPLRPLPQQEAQQEELVRSGKPPAEEKWTARQNEPTVEIDHAQTESGEGLSQVMSYPPPREIYENDARKADLSTLTPNDIQEKVAAGDKFRQIHEALKNSEDALILGGPSQTAQDRSLEKRASSNPFDSSHPDLMPAETTRSDSRNANSELRNEASAIKSLRVEQESFVNTESAARTYTVKEGDNLSKIAREQLGKGATPQDVFEYARSIAQINELKNANLIYAGDALKLPGFSKIEGAGIDIGMRASSTHTDAARDGHMHELPTEAPFAEHQELAQLLKQFPELEKSHPEVKSQLELIQSGKGLTESQIKSVGESLSQILDPHQNLLNLDKKEKLEIATGLIKELSKPGLIRQGWITANESTMTCGQAVVENIVNSQSPDIYAKNVALACTRGTIEVSGKEETVFTSSDLIKQHHAQERPLVSQVFQNAVASWVASQQGQRFVVEDGKEYSVSAEGKHREWGTSSREVVSTLKGLTGNDFSRETDKVANAQDLTRTIAEAGAAHGYPLAVLTQDQHHWVDVMGMQGQQLVVHDPSGMIPEKVSAAKFYEMLDDKTSPNLTVSLVYRGAERKTSEKAGPVNDDTVRGGNEVYTYNTGYGYSNQYSTNNYRHSNSSGLLQGGTSIDVRNYQQGQAAPGSYYPAYPKFNGEIYQNHHRNHAVASEQSHPLYAHLNRDARLQTGIEHFSQPHQHAESRGQIEKPMTAHFHYHNGNETFNMDLKLPPGSPKNGPIDTTVAGFFQLGRSKCVTQTRLVGQMVTDQHGTRYVGSITCLNKGQVLLSGNRQIIWFHK